MKRFFRCVPLLLWGLPSVLVIFGCQRALPPRPERNTFEVYALTEEELATLKKRAIAEGDADAALRISEYYGLSAGDAEKSEEWLQFAAKIGSEPALKTLERRGREKSLQTGETPH
jgi:hypothetical protein